MKALMLWGTAAVANLFAFANSATAASTDYFQPNSTGVKLQNGYERVYIQRLRELQPFGNHAFRVRASIMRDPTGNEWSALIDPPLEGPGGNQGLNHDTTLPYQSSFTIRNGDMVANIENGTISFHRVEPDGSTTLLTGEYVDTKTLLPRFYFQDFRSSSFEAWFSFSSEEDEQLYGTGQQACCKDNSVNKKGQVVDLMNFNSQVTLPVYMSNKGYLHYFNMPSQGRIDVFAEFGHQRTRFVADEATVVDYWITTAPPGDYDALQQQFTAVTGRQPTPPDFMLGYQQSKLRYYNQTQIEDLAQRFHDEQVNVSLIVVDFFAWKFQGDWSFDDSVWPDPAGMAKRVKDLTGAEMMVSLWPSVEDKSVNYLALQQQGLLATTRDGTGIQDSFAGAYTRLGKRLNDSYFSKGIHNFWIDQADGGTLGEPFLNNGQNQIRGIPYSRTFTQYFVGTQSASGKMYPWFHQQAIEEGFQNLTKPDSSFELPTSCEYLSLTRSTFVGGQRFCSYMWSGDTESRFDVLLQQVTAGVSVAASGISAWTLDIGGFSGLNIDTDEGKELFVRWLGMGTFLPFMRVHGTRSCNLPTTSDLPVANPCPNEPWAYGDDNFVIAKKYIALRYQLIPYVKKLFQDLQATGKTIMRPLYYDFSSDPFVSNATQSNDPAVIHQFMLGQRLLIAPVGELGATTKEVYLPILNDKLGVPGATWKHWWTDEDFGPGGSVVSVSAPLDAIPVFYVGSKDDIFSGSV
ncbi:hypothetical protein VNI00_006397 [Paramarasmius palmivorus]|uniref:Glycoside hydrolase family 31 protein n=1 Tax=Paramarasmius palmivorus TaxID=297713 RepID=A0AAW0DB69_9AGAR